jgi:hypothetical protein
MPLCAPRTVPTEECGRKRVWRSRLGSPTRQRLGRKLVRPPVPAREKRTVATWRNDRAWHRSPGTCALEGRCVTGWRILTPSTPWGGLAPGIKCLFVYYTRGPFLTSPGETCLRHSRHTCPTSVSPFPLSLAARDGRGPRSFLAEMRSPLSTIRRGQGTALPDPPFDLTERTERMYNRDNQQGRKRRGRQSMERTKVVSLASRRLARLNRCLAAGIGCTQRKLITCSTS